MNKPHNVDRVCQLMLWFAAIALSGGWCVSVAQAGWAVLPSNPRQVYAGTVTSEGDAVIGGPTVRTNYGVSGAGIKIGIISDSYNALGGAATSVANDNLPAGVTVLNDDLGPLSTDEGRAMAEVIHDVAPGAQLLFHSAFNNATTPGVGGNNIFPTQQSIATAINNLVSAGAKIIVNDAALMNEPFYQDGVIAQAVNNAKANGVAFISAAGNSGNQSVQGTFTASTLNYASQPINDFGGPGTPVEKAMLSLSVSVKAGGTMAATLQWATGYETLGGSSSSVDYNLLAFSAAPGYSYVGGSTRDQHSPLATRLDNDGDGVKDKDPYEILIIKNTGAADATLNLTIARYTGTASLPFKIIVSGNATITDPTFTGSYTLVGSAAADGAMAVGAQDYTLNGAAGSTVETYSALGGTEIRFDQSGNPIALIIRNNPQVVGPDGVSTELLGPNGFDGTSASAAHVAAAAALILQKAAQLNMNMTVDDLYALLYSTATDLETPGFDHKSGYGIINLGAALSALEVPEPAGVAILLGGAMLLMIRRRGR